MTDSRSTKKKFITMVVFGTRPEGIKLAPVIKSLQKIEEVEVKICVTGQHRYMLDQVLNLFDIQPDYDLNVMRPGQDLTDITSMVLQGLKTVFKQSFPDLVIVHGDTTTTLAASLSAYYHRVPVAHVEAGLRTGNIYSPWPEEMNRRIAGGIAVMHFAPTIQARINLENEGIRPELIHVTGNTVIDALFSIIEQARNDSGIRQKFHFLDQSHRLLLVTGHRRENFGGGIDRICRALGMIAERKDVQIVYPVHLNPNVVEPVQNALINRPNIHLIEPLDYLPFVALMDRAYLVITDSGGVQEEAPSLGKPVLVTRETTERPEAVDAGTARLVGTDEQRIINEVTRLLDDPADYAAMAQSQNPYGDGYASERIVGHIKKYFNDLGN